MSSQPSLMSWPHRGILQPDADINMERWKERQHIKQKKYTKRFLNEHFSLCHGSLSVICRFLRNHGKWHLAEHSLAAHGVSVHQNPLGCPPALHCIVDCPPHPHIGQHVLLVPLPRSVHWRRNFCHSRQRQQLLAWKTRSSRWCWVVGSAGGQTSGHRTSIRCQKRAPVCHRTDPWPDGRCGRAPWYHRVGWAAQLWAQDSGRGNVPGKQRRPLKEDEREGQASVLARKSEDSAVGSPPLGW